jgi:L-lactate utilization protein LutB
MNDIEKTIESLNKKGFKAVYVKDAQAALDYVLSVIGKDESVGVGGSITTQETGIVDALLSRGNTLYSHWIAKSKGQNAEEVRRKAMTADAYISSTNALTVAGDLINIDGTGNRTAAMIFGPNKVVVVAGKNKITSNPNTALARIKSVACPKNARRLGYDTPCARTGKCEECSGPDRMCNVVVRLQCPASGKEFHVVIIDGDFGY